MRRLFIGINLSTSLLRAADVKNVVFILVDDLGKHDRGIEGSSFYETPRIGELAKKGICFLRGALEGAVEEIGEATPHCFARPGGASLSFARPGGASLSFARPGG